MTASLVEVVDRWDLVAGAQAKVAGHSPDLRVQRVQLRERDIDGSTVILSVAEDSCHGWSTWAEVSDALVEWVQAEMAAGVAAERDAAGRAIASESGAEGNALWSHTVLVCTAEGDDVERPHCDADHAREVLPTDFTSVVQHGDAVYLGLHASLVCVPTEDSARRLVELIDELHGWWSASWVLDQSLLSTVMETSAALARDSAEELLHVPEVLAGITNDVGTIRTRIDTFRISLGGLEWPVWEAATRRWELADNLDTIARKRELLMDMHGAFLAALQSRRAERLNQIAGFFASVSSVASLVAVIVFVFPTFDQESGQLALRIAVTVTALAVTVVVLLWSSRLLMRAHRPRAHRRRSPAA